MAAAWHCIRLMSLSHLAEAHGQVVGTNHEIRFPLSHQELASLIGVTRETVTINLGQLETAGLVRIHRRKVIIPSLPYLRTEAEGRLAPVVAASPRSKPNRE